MLKYYLQILLIFLLAGCYAITGNAQSFGAFASGVFFVKNGSEETYNVTGGGTPNAVGPNSPNYAGSLGTFNQNSGTLVLAGSEVQTYKNPGANVCGAFLNYRIYQQGSAASGYTSMSLPFKANCAGSVFDDGLGPCGGNDQKWNTQASSLDLTTRCPGTYVVDIYYSIPGSSNNSSACDETSFIGNPDAPAGTMTFTITGNNVPPAITGLMSICAGSNSTLTADNCAGTVSWSNGSIGSTTSVPAGSYTATCTIDGCVSSSSASYVVTEKPVPSAPSISGETMICAGATSTLTASGCSGDVTWSNGASGAATTVTAGTYTATCTIDGCVSPSSASYVVTEKPVPSAPSISGETMICAGATSTLTASGCSGDVTWSNGSIGSTISVPAGTYTATCTVNGCSSEPTSMAYIVQELTPSTPVVSGSNVVCPGANTTLTASNCAGTITWSNGSNGAATNVPAGAYTATCTVSSGGVSCVSQASTAIVVNEVQVTTPTISASATSCPAETAILTASNCSGMITWSNGASGSTLTASPGSYTATCMVNGCVSNASAPLTVQNCPPPCPSNGNLLVNGSFENTVIKKPWSAGVQQGWKNEGFGESGKIETWKSGFSKVPAVQGKQFIELNYENYGIITQNLTVAAGKPIILSYFHRARDKAGERIKVEIVDLATHNVIHSFESSSTKSWQQFSTAFTPTSSNIQLRFVSLDNFSFTGRGNLLDDVKMNYSGCVCPSVPDAPVVTATTTNVGSGSATLTATGCAGGIIKWNNGQTGPTLTTNIPGEYYAICTPSGSTCMSVPSNKVTLTGNTDVSVTCPTFDWRTNGIFHITFCVKNNGLSPASGTAYFKLNDTLEYADNYSNLAPGATQCFTYKRRNIPCGSNLNVQVGTSIVGSDPNLANNDCTGSQVMNCVPNPPPYDPNYKIVSPMRSLEGGIFMQDEWLTYTIHCRNDGLGIAHNVVMIDTIDVTKLDVSTIQVVNSANPVTFRNINDTVVAFDFTGVNLTNSAADLPNSQTEVTFKIKRLPGQPLGTEILNNAGIYFDHEDVVETEYAYSVILEPCDSTVTHPGVVSSSQNIVKGTTANQPFNLTGYTGIITGWEISTDPTFNTNVQSVNNYTSTLSYTNTVDTPTYIRALVQTGDCAIAPSKPAAIYPICGELIKNGSFESPNIGNNSFDFRTTPNWTNLRDGNTLEIHKSAAATDGAQWVELNGNNYGNIYQDFTALPGQTITWSIDHKARSTTNEVITVTVSAPDGSNAQVVSHTGSKTAWQTVTGNYQLAPNQTAVRIRVLGSGGASAASGNYIDNVSANYSGCDGSLAMRGLAFNAEGAAMVESVGISVHPNPVAVSAEIKLNGFEDGIIGIEVLNANGQLVKTIAQKYTSGNSVMLDFGSLHTGLYLIRVKQADKMAITKIVKH